MEDGRLSWAYGLEVLCLILSIVIIVLIYINKHSSLSKSKNDDMLELNTDKNISIVNSGQYNNPVHFDSDRRDSTEYSGSAYTSEFCLSSNEIGILVGGSVTGVTGSTSIGYVSDVTKSTDIVSYAQEPSRRNSQDLNVVSTKQMRSYNSDKNIAAISQSPDPTHLGMQQNRKLSRKSSSSIESVV